MNKKLKNIHGVRKICLAIYPIAYSVQKIWNGGHRKFRIKTCSRPIYNILWRQWISQL